MRLSFPTVSACFLMFISTSTLARADQVDNPRYQAWLKFAVGSSETLSGEVETTVNGAVVKTPIEFACKLVEKTDDHVKTETVSTMIVMGHSQTSPANTEILPAKVEKKDVTLSGTDKVKTAGKTFDCSVYEVAVQENENPQVMDKAKIHLCNDIPGGLVKLESEIPQITLKVLLKSFEIK